MNFYEVVNKRHIVREWKSEDISQEAGERKRAAICKEMECYSEREQGSFRTGDDSSKFVRHVP